MRRFFQPPATWDQLVSQAQKLGAAEGIDGLLWQGRRYDLTVRWAPTSTGDLGAFANYYVDWRNYQRMTANSTFAVRFFGALSNGEVKDLRDSGMIA